MESYLVTQLFTACTKGDLEIVKRLIELGMSPWIRDNQGNTLFHLCCSSVQCGLDVLQYFITVSNSVNYNYLVNNEQQTLLHLACHSGKLDFVEYFFNHQFGSFTSLDIYEHTPLYYACSSRHYNIVSFICNNVTVLFPDIIYQCVKISTWEIMVPLLKKISFKDFMVRVIQEHRVDLAKLVTKDNVVQWLDVKTTFPLHYFAKFDDIRIIDFLITNFEFDLEAEDVYNNRPLHIACAFSGSVELVSYLIKVAGCDINARGLEGRTILHWACEKNHLEVVKFLVTEIKCDLEAEDEYNDRPLHIACAFSGSVELVSYLIKVAGCDINTRGLEGRTILHKACEENHLEVTKFLVTEIKCNLEAEDEYNNRPLHFACAFSGSVELVSYLIKVAGCDINARGVQGRTILHWACVKNQLEVVKFLVTEIKCDLEVEDENSNRPLHIACTFSGSVELVSYLIKVAGCDINTWGLEGRTILHWACEKNHLEVAKFLVTEINCDFEAKDEYNNRPIHIACAFSGSVELVSYLIKVAGCDINARGVQGRTILHWACVKNHLEVVKFLVTEIKCDLEAEDEYNNRPLHFACAFSGSVDLVSYLIKVAGCDINTRGLEGRTILHWACEENHLEVAKFLVTEIKCDFEAKDEYNNRPIHIACAFSGSVDLVSYLIKVAGCDINARGVQGRTILHWACVKNQLEVVKFLVAEIKCGLEAEDEYNNRPLHFACAFSGNVELVSYLIKVAGCDINTRGLEGRTILHWACEENHLEVAKFLVTEIKCDLEAEDEYNNRPLHFACAFSGSVDLVSYLIKVAGCDINARGVQGRTILHCACEKNQLEVVKFLVTEIKCDLKAEDKDSNRPLHIACAFSGSVDLVSYLIKVAGCDINTRGLEGRTILHWACEENHLEVVKFLVTEIKCDLEAEDEYNNRPLHFACAFSGSVDLVSYLIKVAGCDINARGVQGRTILHCACEKNQLEVVKFLVTEIKCDLKAEDEDSNRPLHIACAFSGSVDLVSYLIKVAGCDINTRGLEGRTILHWVCEGNHLEVVKFLVTEIKCDLEAEDEYNNRPLHFACAFSGNVELVSYLIKVAGCDINARGVQGRTILHMACEENHLEVVKFLVTEIKCDPEVKDEHNNRPLHLACAFSGSVDLVSYLIKVAGCDINTRGLEGRTILHKACEENHLEVVKFLVTEINCELEAEDEDSNRPLHLACAFSRSVELVSYLIKVAGCDINARGFQGRTILHKACEKNHLEVVKFLVTEIKCDLEAEDEHNNRPLHLACTFSGSVELVSYLINVAGCDINTRGLEGRTILHKACEENHLEVVKFLVTEIKCDLQAEDEDSNRPLHIACAFSGSVDLVSYLIKVAGCDINATGCQGRTILHKACEKNHLEVVKFLVTEIKCDLEAEDEDSNRPLHLACFLSGNVDLVSYLIKVVGCDINAKGNNEKTCLHYACERNSYDIVKVISAQPQCDLEVKDDYFNSPLQLCFNTCNICICKHLIQEIAKRKRSGNDLIHFMKIINVVTTQTSSNIDDKSDHNNQLLLLASLNGDVENLDILLCAGEFNVNFKGHGGYTLLHCACASNNLACVQYLTAQLNCDVDIQNDDCDRPLHIASCFGSVDITRHLLEGAGCDINSKGNYGYSPLHYACNRSNLEVVQFLTSQTNCNVEVEDDNHDRPLHIASRIGNVDIVMCLVNKAGCDINAKGSNGYTSLHWACEKGCFKMFCSLTTQMTCTANIPNDENDQPLHIAARTGSIDIVRHLVEKTSCDVNAKGKSGYTPLQYACKHSSIEVMEYLLDHPDCDTDVLSSLSDYGDKRVQTVINFHNKFQLAMKSTGVAYLRVVKCILTGPPGAGKSTLKKRLLNESLIEPSLSTGVVDAAVLVDSFRKLQQQGGMVPCLQNVTEWNKQNVDEEAVFILESVSSNTAGQHQVKPIRRKKYKSSSNQMSSLLSAFVSASHENLDSRLTDQLADKEYTVDWETLISANIEGKGQVQEAVENSKDDSSKAKAVKVLSETVQTIPDTEREKYEEKSRQISQDNHAMLHIIDTGGQPEFHEILPALITGPAINLLVFKLTEDLTSRYHITYRSPTGESQPYETSLTHEEVIFRSLASIACLRQNTIGWSFKESPIDDDSEPAAFLVATHRDQVDYSKVTEVNEQLKAKIQKSKLFHENLVQFASPDQLIHAIDTTYDILEIDELRNMLHKVISNKFQELPIPVSWCTFSVKLRKINKSLHDINSCYKLALECGITDKEDFMFALWFLHHRVGSIMHYPEVNGLNDIVITDLQLVFDRITHLITSCFTFKSSGNAALEKNFRTTGRFTEDDIIKLSKKSDDPLSPVILVSLLKHLHIVAGPMSIKNDQKYYFMPCALKPAAIEEEQRDELVCPGPLLIYFECGYCPVGVFCCLVVHLLSTRQSSEMNWTLHHTPHFRNKITFRIGKFYHLVTLVCRATYLEIWADPTISTVPFYEIYQTLDKAIKTVTQSLHYMYKSHHFFGFPCTTCQSAPHPAICEYDDPVAAKCVQGGELMLLGMQHTIWLDEVWLC